MKNKYNEKFMQGMEKSERQTISSISHRLKNDEEMTSNEVRQAFKQIIDTVNNK